MPRRPTDARSAAEAAFKAATTKRDRAPERAAIPRAKEMVSLRIDQDVLEHFQADGPGWQDRLNAALREAAGLEP
ncbi:BrnA antitoxin family protein [Consotaella aegiceratis]|uniref:BrnA antitoxin family protein n=1 Tax=Consotaella aegiceratis TaxID=3097961 RepID=UPI002F3E85A7